MGIEDIVSCDSVLSGVIHKKGWEIILKMQNQPNIKFVLIKTLSYTNLTNKLEGEKKCVSAYNKNCKFSYE